MTEERDDTPPRIAIIGIALRVPGATTTDQFWKNLRAGVESVHTFSPEELAHAGIPRSEYEDPHYIPRKGFLAGADRFDARFFGISPLEARAMDPQHRLFLEGAWTALEDAGYGGRDRGGRVGVYGGVGLNTYWLRYITKDAGLMSLLGGWQASILNDKDFAPTRVSYHLDLKGPSISVNTACSASLVAVHLACQSLLTYECDLALAGGVTVEFPQEEGVLFREGMVYAPDGRCRPFDAAGRGIVDGNGIGIVVLKRLDDALRERDTIRAVILGSAVNNDGGARMGYTAPSVEGQADVVRQALAMAGCGAGTIGYVEAHGTATPIGDPIEVAALTQAFRESTAKTGFCGLGSVKSNLGHLDTAAGVTGLIKTVLCLEHGELVPSLHFAAPNPNIDFASSPFYVCTEHRSWPAGETPRRAGVSSLGIGGTNAHVLVEEPPRPARSASRRSVHLLTISAKTDAALAAARAQLAGFLDETPADLADVAYTLQVGRRAFEHRLAVVGRSPAELAAMLRASESFAPSAAERSPSLVFLFPGQGSQHLRMSQELYETTPAYREVVDRCAAVLRPELGLDLQRVMFSTAASDEERLRDTALAQPALFVVEYALAQLLMAWGVTPQAMIGHSIGEFVAACLAGVFALEDALRLVALRGRLMASTAPGAMLAVNLAEDALRAVLPAELAIGALNESDWTVVSGPTRSVDEFEQVLAERAIARRRLHTSHGFHSPTMEPIVEAFVRAVGRCALSPARLPYISNVTGTWIEPAMPSSPDYWGKHLRRTVRFAAGLETLLAQDPPRTFIEVGPGQALTTMLKRHPRRSGAAGIVPSLPHPQTKVSSEQTMAEALGKLWALGQDIAWPAVHAGDHRQRVPLPTYPFERHRHWVELVHGGGEPGPRPAPSQADSMTYAPSWTRRPVPPPSGQALPAPTGKRWLIFVDRTRWGEALVSELRGAGAAVVAVRTGTTFAGGDGGDFVVDPARTDDLARLITALDQGPGVPQRIVHLLGLDPTPRPGSSERLLAFSGLVSLIGALRQRAAVPAAELRIDLTVVSCGAQAVTGDEALAADSAALLALVRAAEQEHAWLTCRSVDVSDRELAATGWLARQLLSEVRAETPAQLIAYRGRQRWETCFAPVAARPPRAAVGTSAVPGGLRHEGRYLIVGGPGGVAATIARHLVDTAAARVLLVADADADVPASAEPPAGECVAARLYDDGELARCVRTAEQRFGGLDGVVLAQSIDGPLLGGAIGDAPAAELVEQILRHERALPALEAALAGRSLDFCVICSSLSSVLGGGGFSTYAACHLLRDAFVRQHNQRSPQLWTTVNWDRWLDAPRRATDAAGLDRAQALRAFELVLAHPELEQAVVCAGDLATRLARRAAPADAAPQLSPVAPQADDRPQVSTAYVEPHDDTERLLADIWQELLGIARIGVHDDFFELGGHSLLATRFLVRLAERLGTRLKLADFFAHPTVASLSARVRDIAAGYAAETDELERLLTHVEGLSDAEVVAALAPPEPDAPTGAKP